MPPIPSEPASMPSSMKTSTTGTPMRWEVRLKSTLTMSSMPQMVRRRAMDPGSVEGMAVTG